MGMSAPAIAQHVYENPGAAVPVLDMAHYTDAYPWSGATARVLASSFAQLGVKVRTRPVDLNVFVSTIMMNQGIEDMALGYVSGSPDHYTPTYYLNGLNSTDSLLNTTFYSNPEFDKLAAEQAQELDPAKRADLINKAQEVFEEDLPYWYTYIRGSTHVYNKRRWPDLKVMEPMTHLLGLNQLLDATPADPSHTTFVQAWSGEASSWNPFAEGAPGFQARHRWVYDTYTKISYDGELIPWAAESWAWVDPTHINITLRQGMKFHDGVPVTVDDAVFSFNYWIKYQPPLWTSFVANQKSAKKIDDHTFQVELFKPDPDFATIVLSAVIVLPEHIWSKVPEGVGVAKPWDWDPVAAGQVIGSGPFEFVSWRRQQETNFKANKDHFHAPKMDGIRIVQYSSADAVIAAVESGQVDWVSALIPGNIQQALPSRDPDIGFVNEAGFNAGTLWMNNKKAPFNDPVFRKALHLATPYARIRDVAWQGLSLLPGSGPIPNVLPWYDKSLGEPEYNMEKARKLLEDAGYEIRGGQLYYPAH